MGVTGKVGVALHELGARNQLAAIELAEKLGVATAWLTSGLGQDALSIFAAAAARTERVGLGTAIVPTFPRHPLAMVQAATAIAALAPGRLRLGVGTSHRPAIENTFGIPFDRPLGHLREYVTILRAALQGGRFDFTGQHFTVRGEIADPPNVPVLISALRPTSFRLAGEVSDGAISWICPLPYLRDVSMPALREGAARTGRRRPPLVAHCFLAVHEDRAAVREAARSRLRMYQQAPFYQAMWTEAGYPEAQRAELSDAMIDAVVVSGDETAAAAQLRNYLDTGMDELIASTLIVGDDRPASLERTMRLVATL